MIDIAQLLLENGADVNAKNDTGWTPLLLLCRNNEINNLEDIVKFFVENGADVINAKNKNGKTPLHYLEGLQFII